MPSPIGVAHILIKLPMASPLNWVLLPPIPTRRHQLWSTTLQHLFYKFKQLLRPLFNSFLSGLFCCRDRGGVRGGGGGVWEECHRSLQWLSFSNMNLQSSPPLQKKGLPENSIQRQQHGTWIFTWFPAAARTTEIHMTSRGSMDHGHKYGISWPS